MLSMQANNETSVLYLTAFSLTFNYLCGCWAYYMRVRI